MQEVWKFFADNPWVWVVLGLGSAVWIASLVVIFRSDKFLRKWLWVLLSLLTFSFQWSVSPAEAVSIGFPVGAVIILWFWRVGPPPSAEQIAQHEARRQARARGATGSRASVVLLRAAYLVVAAATAGLAWFAVSGALMAAMLDAGQSGSAEFEHNPLVQMIGLGTAALFAIMSLLLVLLSFRPYWWGKIFCSWAGLSWTGFGAGLLLMSHASLAVLWALSAGLAMIGTAITHQIVDPRFGGPYLRTATS